MGKDWVMLKKIVGVLRLELVVVMIFVKIGDMLKNELELKIFRWKYWGILLDR